MNGKCCEPGTIQAFLDGELTPVQSATVTNHIAGCDACALSLARAEEETSIVFPVLERELDTLVPTHRLWARINEGIIEERRSTPVWRRFWSAVMVQIAHPSIAAAAGVLIVFGLFAWVWSLRSTGPVELSPVALVNTQSEGTAAVDPNRGDKEPEIVSEPVPRAIAPTALRASYSPEKVRQPDRAPAVATPAYLPGEESYVKTIANLSHTVNKQKDTALRPSARINYERDMAVVDDAIKRMKSEVRKNPKNESAKQVLYTSYQNKIDLLNSVAEREELVASLK